MIHYALCALCLLSAPLICWGAGKVMGWSLYPGFRGGETLDMLIGVVSVVGGAVAAVSMIVLAIIDFRSLN